MRRIWSLSLTALLALGAGCFGSESDDSDDDSQEAAFDEESDALESLEATTDGPQVCSTWVGVMTAPVEPLRLRAMLCEDEANGEVHGYIRWQGERTGSGMHEIKGSWSEDGTQLALDDVRVAVETLRPPGASLGGIDGYGLTLSGNMLHGSFFSDEGELEGGMTLNFVESTRVGEGT